MDYSNDRFIFTFSNNWKYKQFSLGFTFASEERFTCSDETVGITKKREYYIGLYLGFWQLFVGVVI
jgi:hypothetical protein